MSSGQPMVIPLCDLDPTKRRVTICVRISRMWDYCGNRDKKLAHVDLVLIDEMGNKMYAEIGSGHAAKFKELLKEGGVYLLRDFFVESSKNIFRAVEGRFMIRITPWPKIEPKNDVLVTFPYYVYSLTSFDSLPALVGKKDSFIDVFGIVTSILGLLHVRLPGQSSDSMKRNLQITDISGAPMDVALWGMHATEFDGDELYKIAQSKPIMLLLVGTLIKNYRGHSTISCGEAAKVYIDPDIPERDDYLQRIPDLPAIQWMDPKNDKYRQSFQQSEPDAIKIEYLLTTDPNEYLGKNMICTITVKKVLPSSWWFLSCAACHKTAHTAVDQFVCSDQECKCVAAKPRYRLRHIGADSTGETEFVFFAGVAEQIIGKKVDALTRSAARRPDVIPAEIAALVSQKYTLNVSVNQRGLRYGELSFQVNNIEIVHPKSKLFEFNALASSSSQQDRTPLGTLALQLPLPHDKDACEIRAFGDEMPPPTPGNLGEEDGASTDNTPPGTTKLLGKRLIGSPKKSSVSKKLFK